MNLIYTVLLGLAFAADEGPKVENKTFDILEGVPFVIQLSGCEGGCTLYLQGGRRTWGAGKTITETTTDNAFTWTPSGLSTGVYRIELLNNKSRKYGYGPSFKFVGPESTWTYTPTSPSATSSPTPSSTPTPTPTQSPITNGSPRSGHAIGAIVGVAVGSVAGIAILVAAVCVSLRYRRMVKVLRKDSTAQAWPTARPGSSDPVMRYPSFNKAELDGSQATSAPPTPVELDSKDFRRNERPPSTYEMDAQPMSRKPKDDRTDSGAAVQGEPRRVRQSW